MPFDGIDAAAAQGLVAAMPSDLGQDLPAALALLAVRQRDPTATPGTSASVKASAGGSPSAKAMPPR